MSLQKIRGEYWIITGSVHFADGDVGDTNHTGFALDWLRQEILQAVGFDCEDYDWDEIVLRIPEAVMTLLDLGDDFDEPYARDILISQAEQLGLKVEDINVAFEATTKDVRDHMAETRGWVCCHRNHFSTWRLTAESIRMIAEAIGDILEQEGRFDFDDDEDFDIEIFVVSTLKTYTASWRGLDRGDFSELPLQETMPALGPNAQVAAMDRELEQPFYHNRHD